MGIETLNLQISTVVLYSHQGLKRVVHLSTGRVNVITGSSKTGKSALISIIEYVLSDGECNVPKGILRDTVSWFGLLMCRGQEQFFIARRTPGHGELVTTDAYLEIGTSLEIPHYDQLNPNTTAASIGVRLAEAIGIPENLFEPPAGQTRARFVVRFKHCLFFLFQQQDELISRKHLFHNQSEQWIPQTIKDVLPYFLRAIDEKQYTRRAELQGLREKHRIVKRRLLDSEAIRGVGMGKGGELLMEAADLGLTPPNRPSSYEEMVSRLKQVLVSPISIDSESESSGEALNILLEERGRLLNEMRKLKEELAAVRLLIREEQGFVRELEEQKARLDSLELLPMSSTTCSTCPLCESQIPEPSAVVADIESSLLQLEDQLQGVRKSTPHLRQLESRVSTDLARSKALLQENRRSTDALQASHERIRHLRDQASRRSLVVGRISLYVESLAEVGDQQQLADELARLQKQIDQLEKLLDPAATGERVDSIVSLISEDLTRWGRELGLEHSQYPLRLSIKQLSVTAETPQGPIPMHHMGSGENWVGYHIVSHLALHRFFIKNHCPVPGFLFLDQPSQVYFPSEDFSAASKEDWDAVKRMFRLIIDVAAELAPDLQIIITEHADLNEEWYRDCIVERWRDGHALVPDDWQPSEPPIEPPSTASDEEAV